MIEEAVAVKTRQEDDVVVKPYVKPKRRRRPSGEASAPDKHREAAEPPVLQEDAQPEATPSPVDEQTESISHNRELGMRGEQAAMRYLERRGFEILERNWTCPFGEADIIAQDGSTLVFVEVKTRSNTDKGLPEEAVGKDKRARYERIAALFLQSYDAVDVSVRFDVISILVLGTDKAFLRHHVSAFSSDE